MALRRNKDGSALTPHQVYSTEAQSEAHAKYQRRREDQAAAFQARLKARAERTPAQQLAELDRRLGVGVGAVRERARLQKLAGA